MEPQRGQVLVLFALLILVLLGFLGLALDGGYYFASSRAVAIAADTAARAALVQVRRAQAGTGSLYSSATSDGVAIGQRNLANAGITGITITIEYNDSPNATASGGGWYGTPPRASTVASRARVNGTYNTFFLKAVGVPSLGIDRLGVGGQLAPVVVMRRTLPLSICTATITLNPNGPWTLWDRRSTATLCSLSGWHGLTNLDNRSPMTCFDYQTWLGPPPAGPLPLEGSTVGMDRLNCPNLTSGPASGLQNTTQLIPEISSLLGLTAAQVAGCRQVLITQVSGDLIQGTPVGGRVPCGVLQTN
jgi:Flp pilus assembly protein TadG